MIYRAVFFYFSLLGVLVDNIMSNLPEVRRNVLCGIGVLLVLIDN